jgi:hypothetical protein
VTDTAILKQFDSEYRDGVVIVRRAKPPAARAKRAKKVNVYIDGVLTVMSEDILNHFIEVGFFVRVQRRP